MIKIILNNTEVDISTSDPNTFMKHVEDGETYLFVKVVRKELKQFKDPKGVMLNVRQFNDDFTHYVYVAHTFFDNRVEIMMRKV